MHTSRCTLIKAGKTKKAKKGKHGQGRQGKERQGKTVSGSACAFQKGIRAKFFANVFENRADLANNAALCVGDRGCRE